jgi:beta-galactosidase
MKRTMNSKCLIPILVALFCGNTLGTTAQKLYVGANYHPHDVPAAQWPEDIRRMREAGFTVVRVGHLAWDSYEPADGQFTFEWFDPVMDAMAEAGIRVILDIAVRPAPLWLHRKHPSMSITTADGDVLYPNHRYMVDVGDPHFQRHALRFTEAMTRRYAGHPALLAFGIDNEPGDGRISYSEPVRQRFIDWLKAKYTTTESLNTAWAGQRWSRRVGDFEEVGLPLSGSIAGPPERVLDFRRFLSDEINGFYFSMIDVVNRNAPGALTNTNAWYYNDRKYYDYVPMAYSGLMTRQGNGFYPGYSLKDNPAIFRSLFGITRIQFESTEPFWCNEFTTMTAPPGAVRKYAYATLMYGNAMVCGWTWQTMHGGEEQFLQGMIDWDGEPNEKYAEYRQLAAEFEKLEPWFPYRLRAEVGLAYSFASQMASGAFPVRHDGQLRTFFDLFLQRNVDVRMLDIARSELDYKLLIVPGVAVMEPEAAAKIRAFVEKGGTVVMTDPSAVLEATGQVFATTQPGYLADLFGIRVGGFAETRYLNELSRLNYAGDRLRIALDGTDIEASSARFARVQPRGAEVLATITSLDRDYPVATAHRYGKGTAIYIGIPAESNVLEPLIDRCLAELAIDRGPEVPAGVMARRIDDRHVLYLNLNPEPVTIRIPDKARSILRDSDYAGTFDLPANEPDFIELK